MPIKDVDPRYPKLGTISAGYRVAKRSPRGTILYPVKSETFVFASEDRERLEYVARVFGGRVEPSPDPKHEGGRFRVITRTREIEVYIPSEPWKDDLTWSAWWEFWTAAGCQRRCDGEECKFAIDPKTGERREKIPCVCKAMGLSRYDPNHCRLFSRLYVVVSALAGAPGLGFWQFVSRGVESWQNLEGGLRLTKETFRRVAGIPMILRITLRRSRGNTPGEVRTYPTVQIIPRKSYEDALREMGMPGVTVAPEALPAPAEAALPQTGTESGEVPTPVPAPELEPVAAPDEIEVDLYPEEQEEEESPPPPEPDDDYGYEFQGEEPDASPPDEPAAPHRDYTLFWKTVREAARVEGDADAHAWLERVAGTRDPRLLSDTAFREALRAAEAASRGTTTVGEAAPRRDSAPDRKQQVRGGAAGGKASLPPELVNRMADQLRKRARDVGVSEEELLALLQAASHNGSDPGSVEQAIARGGYSVFSEVYRALSLRQREADRDE